MAKPDGLLSLTRYTGTRDPDDFSERLRGCVYRERERERSARRRERAREDGYCNGTLVPGARTRRGRERDWYMILANGVDVIRGAGCRRRSKRERSSETEREERESGLVVERGGGGGEENKCRESGPESKRERSRRAVQTGCPDSTEGRLLCLHRARARGSRVDARTSVCVCVCLCVCTQTPNGVGLSPPFPFHRGSTIAGDCQLAPRKGGMCICIGK